MVTSNIAKVMKLVAHPAFHGFIAIFTLIAAVLAIL
jgi:hypothetical protein